GEWPAAWDDALAVSAWEHWLITGRLAAYRAEWELEAGNYDDAVTWARRAIDAARTSPRRKYEAIAQTLLGRALTARGLGEAAASELGTAVEIPDARGALARARGTSPDGADPEAPLQEAATIVRDVAGSLAPERAEVYLAAPQVVGVLGAPGWGLAGAPRGGAVVREAVHASQPSLVVPVRAHDEDLRVIGPPRERDRAPVGGPGGIAVPRVVPGHAHPGGAARAPPQSPASPCPIVNGAAPCR